MHCLNKFSGENFSLPCFSARKKLSKYREKMLKTNDNYAFLNFEKLYRESKRKCCYTSKNTIS